MTTPEDNSKRRRYVADLLLGLLPLLIGIQLIGWISIFQGALRGHSDFRQLYAAGYMVRTGHGGELYSYAAQTRFQDSLVSSDQLALPFIRPAYQALLFVPLSRLSYRVAYLVFLAVNLIILAVSISLLLPRIRNLSAVWRWFPVGMVLGFLPVAAGLVQGQDSILLLALLAAALAAIERDSELAAGFLVGMALFKMQIVIPLALLFFIWRRWRFVAGFAVSAGLASLVSLWVVGFAETVAYANSVFLVGSGVGTDHFKFPLRVSVMANLRGLIFGLFENRVLPFWIQAFTVILSGLLLLWIATTASRKIPPGDAFALAITASVVVSYYLFIHDLIVLLIPIAIALDRFLEAAPKRQAVGWLIAGSSVALLVSPMCMFVTPNYFYLVSLPLLVFLFGMMLNLRPSPLPQDAGGNLQLARPQ